MTGCLRDTHFSKCILYARWTSSGGTASSAAMLLDNNGCIAWSYAHPLVSFANQLTDIDATYRTTSHSPTAVHPSPVRLRHLRRLLRHRLPLRCTLLPQLCLRLKMRSRCGHNLRDPFSFVSSTLPFAASHRLPLLSSPSFRCGPVGNSHDTKSLLFRSSSSEVPPLSSPQAGNDYHHFPIPM